MARDSGFPTRRFLSDRVPRRLTLAAAVLGFFGLVSLITLYPLIFENGQRAAGYDWFFPHWAFWWVRHALTTEGLHVYESNFVMAPYTTNYAYNVLTLLWFPMWAALEPLVGTLTAVTAIIWLACTLNGALFFWFLRSEAVAPGWALLGGVALQTFPVVRYFYYNTHINLMNWFLLPVLLLIWKGIAAAVRARQPRRALAGALGMGVALWATVLADLQFPLFAVFVLGPYGLLTLWRSPARRHLVALGALALSLAVALLWLAGPLPYLMDVRGTLVPGPVEDRPTIDFPADFVSMAETWWDWSTPSLGGFVTLAMLATLIFAIVRAPRGGPERWVWVVVALLPLLFAVGPTLRLGALEIPMPYRLLYAATDGNYRMPWRLAPAFALGAMVFIGKVWTPRVPASVAGRAFLFGGLFFVLALDVRLFEGGPTQPVLPEYETYARLGEEPYDYVVVEVPTGAGSGETLLGDPDAIPLQYYGITHGKRMVNGFISRAPVEHFWYLHTGDPMLSWLGQRRLLDADAFEAQLRERIFEWPIGYLVVHQDLIRQNAVRPEEVIGHLNSLHDLLCAPFVEGDALFYRTRWHPDGCPSRSLPEPEPGVYVLDLGAAGDERYIGAAWHWQETVAGVTWRWAGEQPQALLYVDLPPGDYTLELVMQAYAQPRKVRLAVNGNPLDGEATAQPGQLNVYSFQVPAEVFDAGSTLALSLEYDGWTVPAEIGAGDDQRRLAIAVDELRFIRNTD